MTQQPPRTLTVIVDDREKNALVFPHTLHWWDGSRYHLLRITTQRRRMRTGDYALLGHEGVCLVERKGRLEELWTNFCTKDFTRMYRCLQRLTTECTHPVLLLDMPVHRALISTRYAPEPPRLWDTMLRRLMRDGIHVLWVPQGTGPRSAVRSGELVLRYMWAAAWNTQQLLKPVVLETHAC